jgi:predicted O-methyltransferase YrrM
MLLDKRQELPSGINIIKQIKIHSAIKKEEGANITRIINKYKLKKCLEIGMAFGISAFYILTATSYIL